MGGVLGVSSSSGQSLKGGGESVNKEPINIVCTQDVFDRWRYWQEIGDKNSRMEKQWLNIQSKEEENSRNSPMVPAAPVEEVASTSTTDISNPVLMMESSSIEMEKRFDNEVSSSKGDSPSSDVKGMEAVKNAVEFAGHEEHVTGGTNPFAASGRGDRHEGNQSGIQTIQVPTMTPFSLAVDKHEKDGLFRPRADFNSNLYNAATLLPIEEGQSLLNESGDLKARSASTTPGESGMIEAHMNFLKFVDESGRSLLSPGPGGAFSSRNVPPFIPDLEVELPDNLSLNVLTNLAKDCYSKLPEVESLKSSDFGEIHSQAVEKCQKIGEYWTHKLDSRIHEVSTTLDSDMDQFLQRAERVLEKIPPPRKNSTCIKLYADVADCYSKNKDEVFKCQDVIKAFSNCVGQNDWSGIQRHN